MPTIISSNATKQTLPPFNNKTIFPSSFHPHYPTDINSAEPTIIWRSVINSPESWPYLTKIEQSSSSTTLPVPLKGPHSWSFRTDCTWTVKGRLSLTWNSSCISKIHRLVMVSMGIRRIVIWLRPFIWQEKRQVITRLNTTRSIQRKAFIRKNAWYCMHWCCKSRR